MRRARRPVLVVPSQLADGHVAAAALPETDTSTDPRDNKE
jgi:hypothetical protein